VYKFIQRFLDRLFRKDELLEEYELILNSINNATSLADLFIARAGVLKFHEKIKARNSPTYLRDKVKILLNRWDVRYRMWKIQSRG